MGGRIPGLFFDTLNIHCHSQGQLSLGRRRRSVNAEARTHFVVCLPVPPLIYPVPATPECSTNYLQSKARSASSLESIAITTTLCSTSVSAMVCLPDRREVPISMSERLF